MLPMTCRAASLSVSAIRGPFDLGARRRFLIGFRRRVFVAITSSPKSVLIRRIQIRILPHLALHLLALFFVIQKHEPIAQVASLDLALGPLEQAEIALC